MHNSLTCFFLRPCASFLWNKTSQMGQIHCSWEYIFIGICEQVCMWLHTCGYIHVVTYMWLHTCGYIHVVTYMWLHMWLHTCGYIPVVTYVWLHTCRYTYVWLHTCGYIRVGIKLSTSNYYLYTFSSITLLNVVLHVPINRFIHNLFQKRGKLRQKHPICLSSVTAQYL